MRGAGLKCRPLHGILSISLDHLFRFFSYVFYVGMVLSSLFFHHGSRVKFAELPCWDARLEHIVQFFQASSERYQLKSKKLSG